MKDLGKTRSEKLPFTIVKKLENKKNALSPQSSSEARQQHRESTQNPNSLNP